jgi:protein-tyrosine-phosphatase
MNLGSDPSTVRLLFVCTGNLCRSAAADRLMSDWAAASGAPVVVRSAGTRARAGRPIHPKTARALERHGVSGEGFASGRLAAGDIDWADVVLTMTAEHRDEVVGVAPRGMQKVFTLLEADRLCRTLPPSSLHCGEGEHRGAMLVNGLRESRSKHTQAHGSELDIIDPIDGPQRLHIGVVDQIASALRPLMSLLDVSGPGEQTLRMPRLPPVPRAT